MSKGEKLSDVIQVCNQSISAKTISPFLNS